MEDSGIYDERGGRQMDDERKSWEKSVGMETDERKIEQGRGKGDSKEVLGGDRKIEEKESDRKVGTGEKGIL